MRKKGKRIGESSKYAVVPTPSGGVSLTRLQEAKRQQELEREKVTREARELGELEVCYAPSVPGE